MSFLLNFWDPLQQNFDSTLFSGRT